MIKGLASNLSQEKSSGLWKMKDRKRARHLMDDQSSKERTQTHTHARARTQ